MSPRAQSRGYFMTSGSIGVDCARPDNKNGLLKLQTNISLQSAEYPISYDSQLLLLGSCFATNIGKKLDYFQFRNLQNPFGILFNPKAIATFLWRVVSEEQYIKDDLFFHNEQWHCFDAHSELSDPDAALVLERLNTALSQTLEQLSRASHIILTLGTAWGYRLKALDEIVANCHKIPQSEFEKVLLPITAVQLYLEEIVNYLKAINPTIQIVLTISPIRHLKDGFVENTRSKAHLIAGVQEFVSRTTQVQYFPAYELQMDELRDYRFYDRDMVHPNALAIDYIWERFCKVYMTDQTLETMEQVATVQKGTAHRPFNPKSEQHQKFLQTLEKRKQTLQSSYPFMTF